MGLGWDGWYETSPASQKAKKEWGHTTLGHFLYLYLYLYVKKGTKGLALSARIMLK